MRADDAASKEYPPGPTARHRWTALPPVEFTPALKQLASAEEEAKRVLADVEVLIAAHRRDDTVQRQTIAQLLRCAVELAAKNNLLGDEGDDDVQPNSVDGMIVVGPGRDAAHRVMLRRLNPRFIMRVSDIRVTSVARSICRALPHAAPRRGDGPADPQGGGAGPGAVIARHAIGTLWVPLVARVKRQSHDPACSICEALPRGEATDWDREHDRSQSLFVRRVRHGERQDPADIARHVIRTIVSRVQRHPMTWRALNAWP